MPEIAFNRQTRPSRPEAYLYVVHALMLRDMRTRFGGTMWGYLAQVLWPVTHVFVVSTIMVFRHMPAPVGSSILLFVTTGAYPALGFQYIAREIMKGVLVNKPLTYYPQVRMFDVMVSRALVETIGSFIGVFIVFGLLFSFGVSPLPADGYVVIEGYCAALLLGISVGTVNASIVAVFPAWMIGFIVIQLALYLTSGIYFLPNYLPDVVYGYLKWNPITQVIEWVRSGYYPELTVQVDKLYTLCFAFTVLTIGLLLNRKIHR